jgi:hypothetical protein
MVFKYPSDMNDLRPLAWPAFNASTTNCTQSTITGGSVAWQDDSVPRSR